jgi:L-cystine transport system substrate-binding protein
MKKWKIPAVLALVASLGALGACGTAANAKDANGVTTVKFAMETQDPPYSYQDKAGNPTGFDLDVLKALDKQLPSYKFEYQSVDYETALVGVKQGKYDALIGAFFKTPARAKQYLLSKPYNYYFMNLIVPEDSKISTLEDLNGKTLNPIVPTDGRYVAIQAWLKKHPDVKIDIPTVSNQETFVDMINSVHDGTYDALYLSKDQYNGVKDSLGYKMKVTDAVDGAGTVILYGQDQKDLQADLDKAISAAISDKTIPDLSQKWFKQDTFAIAEKLGLTE